MNSQLKIFLKLIFEIIFLPFFLLILLFIRPFITRKKVPKLVWGPIPILNNFYWSKSFKNSIYFSETFTYNYYSTINQRNNWDEILEEKYFFLPSFLKPYLGFIESLINYDIFFLPFSGYFLGFTNIWFLEAYIFKFFNKKIVSMPYGADAYVYSRVKSTTLIHALLLSYPEAARNQYILKSKVDYWIKHSDLVISGIMGPDGIGRWDVLIPSILFIDLNLWEPSTRNQTDEKIKIVHTPNHKGFKGTEFIVKAVNELIEEGLNIELILLENIQNDIVRNILKNEADILIEQIIAPGHALSALEGMASGLPVISNLEDDNYLLPFRRWSYFKECPIVSANPENIKIVLKNLILDKTLRIKLGKEGRKYVEKYHGLDSSFFLFDKCIKYLNKENITKEDLLNMYHPICNTYLNKHIKIQNPLINNKIVQESN